MDVMEDPTWALRPNIKQFALDYLDDMEKIELLVVLQNTLTHDFYAFHKAFIWGESPQGDNYWRKICMEVYAGLRVRLSEPEWVGFDPAEEPQGWQPDVVDGASVMGITRGLF
jgi:hypothetical protein